MNGPKASAELAACFPSSVSIFSMMVTLSAGLMARASWLAVLAHKGFISFVVLCIWIAAFLILRRRRFLDQPLVLILWLISSTCKYSVRYSLARMR